MFLKGSCKNHLASRALTATAGALLCLALHGGPALGAEGGSDEAPTEGAASGDAEATAESEAEAKAADEAAEKEQEVIERLKRSIRVIQQRPFLKDLRFELQLMGGVTVNQEMYTHPAAVAQGRLHIGEEWSVGLGYTHYFGDTSGLFDDVVDNFELFSERALMNFYAGLDVTYSPIYGKFTFFNGAIVHFDIYLAIGGGVTWTTKADNPKPTGMVGIGWRLFLTRWLTMVVEVRDHIYPQTYNKAPDDPEIVNNVVFQGGFGFFLPPDFDYQFGR